MMAERGRERESCLTKIRELLLTLRLNSGVVDATGCVSINKVRPLQLLDPPKSKLPRFSV